MEMRERENEMRLQPIDNERWRAVAKAREIAGMAFRDMDDEEALCKLILWADENPHHPAGDWLKRNLCCWLRVVFCCDWNSLK